MPKSPTEVAAKWKQRTAASTQAYRDGVQSVTEAPGAAAARNIDRMINRLIELRDSGELARAMSSVSLESWKQSTLEKGSQRIAGGVQAAEGKMANFMAEFLPFAESVSQSLPPRGDFSQNMQRMVDNATKLHEFKRSR